jgi:TolB protein
MDNAVTADLTTPEADHRAAGPRPPRRSGPVLTVAAVAAVAAIAVGVTAITTSRDGSLAKPQLPASQASPLAPNSSAAGSSASTTVASTSAANIAAPGTTAPVHRPSAAATTRPGQPVQAQPVLLKYGAQQGRAQVPWSQVGPGWFLALTDGGAPSLYLINPIGGRYLITTHLPTARDGIAAWSPDGKRVMLSRQETSGHMIFTELELATGRVLHTIDAGESASFVSYTRPEGRAILVSRFDGKTSSLQRLGTDGSHQLTYPGTLPGVGKVAADWRGIYTADGTELLVGAVNGIALLGNDGHLIRPLPAPPAEKHCMPLTWWDAATALMSCTNEAVRGQLYSFPTELFLQPVAGGRPSKLAGGSAQSYPFGFVDAWKYSGGVVLREGSGCGPGELDVLRNGVISRLRLPAGVVTPTPVYGFDGDTITVRQRSVCGPIPDAGSVISYNLVTGDTITLFKGSASLIDYPSR